MKIKLISDSVRGGSNLYRLFDPGLTIYRRYGLLEYKVEREQEMRPDLVMKAIYDLDELDNIDIILYLNGIDNPLNIKEGMILLYPDYKDLEKYRYKITGNELTEKTNSVQKQLSVPNKTTRKDSSRKKYIDNGFSLPPVVLPAPKEPVRLDGKNILVGGL
jgi:hypothetical protein